MATVTVQPFFSIDMKRINLSGMFEGTVVSSTSSRFEVDFGNGDALRYGGHGLKYDSNDRPIGGTVTSFDLVLWRRGGIVFEDIKIGAASFFNAAKTQGTADDWKVFEKILRGNDSLLGGPGSDQLYGFAGHDRMDGGGLDDTLMGGSGNDRITGDVGSDVLHGENGNDHLNGGIGADKLYGGAGADRFIFTSIDDSTPSWMGRDRIYDFKRSEKDKIVLNTIDADTQTAGNQAFRFIGAEKFHVRPGELRYEKKPGGTVIQADVDGDGKADFSLVLNTGIDLKASDFIL